MTWLSQLRSHAIAAFLSPAGQGLAAALRHLRHGGLPGRGEVELYHDPADPISHLMLQKVSQSGIPGRLWVVGTPRSEVDPAPEARLRWRLSDARRLAHHHGLSLGTTLGAGAPRVRAALAVPRPFQEHLALAIQLGEALWSNDQGLDALLAALPTSDHRADDRMWDRGFYEGGALYWRGRWFNGLDRWDHFEARHKGQLPGPPRAPDSATKIDQDDLIITFISFRSPYSYLAIERLFELVERTGARLEVRPVLPMVMRGLSVPRIKRLFLVQDAAREARRHKVPFGRIADPLGVGVERCLAVFCGLDDPDLRHSFLRTAARGIWSEALDMADDADLRTVTDRAGVSWAVVEAALLDTRWREQVEDNRQELLATGLWGVPCFIAGQTVLWGQDRLVWLRG